MNVTRCVHTLSFDLSNTQTRPPFFLGTSAAFLFNLKLKNEMAHKIQCLSCLMHAHLRFSGLSNKKSEFRENEIKN